MKAFKAALLLILVVTGVILLCENCSTDGKYPYYAAVEVVENGDFDDLALTGEQRNVVKVGDSVWMNMSTHLIDTVDRYSMLVRVISMEE